MNNWQSKDGKRKLIEELKIIEKSFAKSNLRWDRIKRQGEDALSVTVDIIKRQVRNGLIELKEGFTKDDELYKAI